MDDLRILGLSGAPADAPAGPLRLRDGGASALDSSRHVSVSLQLRRNRTSAAAKLSDWSVDTL